MSSANRWNSRASGLAVLGLGVLLALAGVAVLPAVAQGYPTETETLAPVVTYLPTATAYATVTVPTQVVPPLPDLPEWPGSRWYIGPTDVYLPGCPDWSLIDPAVGQPEDLAYQWMAQCPQCLPFAPGGDPSQPSTPGGYGTPSPTPLAAGGYELSNYVGWEHELWHYDTPPEAGMAYPFWQPFYATYLAESYFISGVRFTLSHPGEGYAGAGQCKLRTDPHYAGSVFDQVTWLDEPGATYCFGPASACASLVPGAKYFNNYRIIPPASRSLLGWQVGDYPAECGSDMWKVSDLQWILYRMDQAYTATPQPTSTSPVSYRKSCSGTLRIPFTAGENQMTFQVGPAQPPVLYTQVDAVVFNVVSNGTTVRLAEAEADSFWPANLVGTVLEDGYYCIGTGAACQARGPETSFTFFEAPAWDISTKKYKAFSVEASGSGDVYLTGSYAIYLGSQDPECEPPLQEATPTPSPSPTGSTSTPVPQCSYQFGSYTVAEQWRLSTLTVTLVSAQHYRVHAVFDNSDYNGGFRIQFYPTGSSGASSVKWRLVAPGLSLERYAFYNSGDWEVSNSVQGYGPPQWDFTAWDQYNASALLSGSFKLYSITSAVDVEVYITECGGLPAGDTPTPTPSPTPSPSAQPTRTLVPTPTATPRLGGSLCEYPAFREKSIPAIGGSLNPEDWGDLIDFDHPNCYTLIPGFGFHLPSAAGGGEVEIPQFELCTQTVKFPQFSLLGIPFALDWILVPFFAFVIRLLMSL